MLRKCLLIIKKESTNGYHYKVTFHCIFCKIKAKESKILICYLYFLFFCLDPYPKQTIPHPTGSGIRITTLNCILHNPYWRQQTSCLTIGRIRSNILSHTIFLKIYNFVCVKTGFFYPWSQLLQGRCQNHNNFYTHKTFLRRRSFDQFRFSSVSVGG